MPKAALLTYQDALKRILKDAPPVSSELCLLGDTLGRVTAAIVAATCDLPPFDNSAVDGYAIHESDRKRLKSDATLTLTQAGALAAGDDAARMEVKPGTTVRIFTGAPTPAGTAAVAMQEDVKASGTRATFSGSLRSGESVRSRGEEVRCGDVVLPSGCLLSPATIALAAAAGCAEIQVAKLPRMGILATGEELTSPGASLGPGQIYESNSYGLAAALAGLGMTNVKVERAGDDAASVGAAASKLLQETDVLLISGGVSVGDHDPVKPALRDLGVETVFWGIAMKPGKPFYYGRLGDKPVFGLPGNPLSAMTTFYVLVRPYLLAGMGLPAEPPAQKAQVSETIKKPKGRLEFLPGTVTNGKFKATLHRPSHMLSGLASADCYGILPADEQTLEKGQTIELLPIRWALL